VDFATLHRLPEMTKIEQNVSKVRYARKLRDKKLTEKNKVAFTWRLGRRRGRSSAEVEVGINSGIDHWVNAGALVVC